MRQNNYRPPSYSMMAVYEGNYRKLMRIIPDIRLLHGTVYSEFNGRPILFLEVLEQCKYTSMLAITHYLSLEDRLVTDFFMELRVYHDARLAEVSDYQHQTQLLPVYSYPNKQMYQPYEKQQVNLFLEEWLQYCLRYGCQFEQLADPGVS